MNLENPSKNIKIRPKIVKLVFETLKLLIQLFKCVFYYWFSKNRGPNQSIIVKVWLPDPSLWANGSHPVNRLQHPAAAATT